MILIDKPYVSDFLINIIKEKQLPIIATKTAKEMIGEQNLKWISEEDAKVHFQQNPDAKIYTNSENAIQWLEDHLPETRFPKQAEIFKNKVKFRELIADQYPDYFFRSVKYSALKNLDINQIKFPIVLKPSVGFFSIGVSRIDNASEWSETISKLDSEIEKTKHLYPEKVVNVSDFIIEQVIEGNEFAVDCYFDEKGEPVILNILHHVFSSGKDVSDRIYSTSKQIIESNHDNVMNFLKMVNSKTHLKNFPAHVEIRIDDNGKINPIEINPLRFGGWCTTADLTWYSYGINSYEYFLKGLKPDWEKVFSTRQNKIYSIVILDNNSGIHSSEIEYFDFDKLLQDFEKPLDLRKVDYNVQPFFAIMFVETTMGNEAELDEILTSNLQKYIVKK
ncbi:MAG: ATP-grasp domain-containing protein [Candidatus Marinimicrobia bacterium]|nr:ATP-grasp domain-containing protein [Candidatus Neomarinimicrobiota bacterium]